MQDRDTDYDKGRLLTSHSLFGANYIYNILTNTCFIHKMSFNNYFHCLIINDVLIL